MTLEKLASRMESLRLTQTAAVLGELAHASAADKETPLEFLERVLEAEYSGREERRIATSLKLSGLPKGMRRRTSITCSNRRSNGTASNTWVRATF